jgi:hypothetical protein
LIQRLRQNPGLGYSIIGVVSETKKTGGGRLQNYRHFVPFFKNIQKHNPGEVIFALPATAHARLIPMLVFASGQPDQI